MLVRRRVSFPSSLVSSPSATQGLKERQKTCGQPDFRPVQRPIEQCVFPVQHSPLERNHFAADALACWVSALVVWTGQGGVIRS
jgi:hypothetical protein